MIAAGYEDGNDADSLRSDPMFKMALDLTPSDRELCSQPNDLPVGEPARRPCPAAHGARHGRSLLRVLFQGSQADRAGYRRHVRRGSRRPAIALVQRALRRIRLSTHRRVRWRGPFHHCCAAPGQTPRRQGDQGLSAPPAARHSRQLASGRDSGARRQPAIALPEVLDFCRANRLDYILGVAPTSTLRRHIEGLEAATKTQYETTPGNGKARRFKEFYDGAASWSRVERVIARVEVGARDRTRASSSPIYNDATPPALRGRVLPAQPGRPHQILEAHLAADRTSCTKASANQLRLFLHAGAYWIMWGLRRVDAEAFDVACSAVRHLAPAPDQNCRTRSRDEDDDPRAPADIVSGATHFPLCARTNPAFRNPALRHLTGGA